MKKSGTHFELRFFVRFCSSVESLEAVCRDVGFQRAVHEESL